MTANLALCCGPVLAQAGSNAALTTFLIYTLAVFGLAALSNRLLQSKSFLSEYFLGSRGLGVWAFAMTFAATSASGGSFTGFPSKIYSHGWILALWIGSYMVVPICTMGFLGKRLNQVARISGAITVPDVLRDRFGSRSFGLLAVLLIVFFMSFNLIAQFKAGSLILKTLLHDVEMFHQMSAAWLGGVTADGAALAGVDPEYLFCLFAFGAAVIVYTTYGGFHAVVWTDVMQGIVMVIGVMIMLPLALSQAAKMAPEGTSGLEYTTREMAKMTPPRRGEATLTLNAPSDGDLLVPAGSWFTSPAEAAGQQTRLFRLNQTTRIPAGDASQRTGQKGILEITTPSEIEKILERLRSGDDSLPGQLRLDIGLTNIDVDSYAYPPNPEDATTPQQSGSYVSGPGPDPNSEMGFLPLSLAVSFFFMWAISGTGQPSNMVRLMAFRDSTTLRRAIITVSVYYSAIYFPLVIIFCCARLLLPGMDAESDRIMPAMAVTLTQQAGIAWVAGLLVAAPFAAVMSTVDSFLLMISSALVRDIYQRNINPDASEKRLKKLSYLITLLVGSVAVFGAINPPAFLQDIIVYTGSGLAAAFLAPVVFAVYWPRSNAAGCMAGMIGGFAAHLSMYVAGMFVEGGSFFRPYRFLNFDPIIVGLFVSFASVYIVTKITPAPDPNRVRRYFFRVDNSAAGNSTAGPTSPKQS